MSRMSIDSTTKARVLSHLDISWHTLRGASGDECREFLPDRLYGTALLENSTLRGAIYSTFFIKVSISISPSLFYYNDDSGGGGGGGGGDDDDDEYTNTAASPASFYSYTHQPSLSCPNSIELHTALPSLSQCSSDHDKLCEG